MELQDLVDPLRRAINPPGEDNFPNASDIVLKGFLRDALALARLDKTVPAKWTVVADEIVNVDDLAEAFPEDLATIVVVYAKIQILRNHILNVRSKFRAVAGPVEYETQQAVTHLRDMLKTYTDELAAIKDNQIEVAVSRAGYIDLVCNRVHGGWQNV